MAAAVQRITIRNFQSHAQTVIEPAPPGRLTVITGPSDAGKTAIIRALKWAFYNQPQGDGFRRVGCEFVDVELDFEDGQTVSRRRTASTNRYAVNGKLFEGFGTSVPLEVQAVTGVRPVRINDQDIMANIASQLEAPFLGSSISGPARAKVLGKLAGTEVIDQANRELNTDLFRLRQDAKRLESEVDTLEEQISDYDYLPRLAAQIEKLRVLLSAIQTAEEKLLALKTIANRLRTISIQQQSARAVLARIGNLDLISQFWSEATLASTKLKQLTATHQTLTTINGRISKGKEYVAQLGDVDGAANSINQAATANDTLSRYQSAYLRLRTMSEGIRRNQAVLASLVGLDEAALHVTSVAENRERHAALNLLYQRLIAVSTLCRRHEETLNRLGDVDGAWQAVAGNTELSAKCSALKGLKASLERIQLQHTQAAGALERASETLLRAQEEYKTELKNAGRCPTCGSEINDKRVEEAIAS